MKRLHIILIVILSILMVSLCGILGFYLTNGTGHWMRFGVQVDHIDVKNIDVGSVVTGNIDTGDIDTGDLHTGNTGVEKVDAVGDAQAEESGHFFQWDAGEDYTLVMEETVPAEDIRSLKVWYDTGSNDVLFYLGTGDDILIREYRSSGADESRISTVEEKDGELTVRGGRKAFFSFLSFRTWSAYTEIYLPLDAMKDLEKLQVKTVSGYVLSDIPFANLRDFAVTTTSGDVFFPDVEADEVRASSTSGYIRLASASAEQISVSTVSGDILLDRASGDAKLSTTSGDVFLPEIRGELQVSTTSGDVSLGQVTGDMTLSTTSGEFRLEKGQGELDAGSVSGDIRVDSLDGGFSLNTTSGTLSIAEGRGYGRASSVSGDIRIFLAGLRGNLTISTTSGSMDISLPKEASLELTFDSTSGECNTFFDESLSFNKRGNKAEGRYNGGDNIIDVSSTSGDLLITDYGTP